MKKITFLLAALSVVFYSNAQSIIFSDNFDAETIDATTYANWVATDDDEDNNNWEVFDATNTLYDSDDDMVGDTPYAWSMSGLAADSDSWEAGVAFTPDNFLTTMNPLDLTNSSGTSLTYTVGTYQTNGSFIADQYAVYLTASNAISDIMSATAVTTRTVADDVSADVADGSASAAIVTIDISAFDGQTVYLTFRHFNSNDENSILLDDILVEGTLGVQDFEIFDFKYAINNGALNLVANQPLESLTIYNILGQKVIEKGLSGTTETISMSTLKPGIYLGKITIEGQTKTFKFALK